MKRLLSFVLALAVMVMAIPGMQLNVAAAEAPAPPVLRYGVGYTFLSVRSPALDISHELYDMENFQRLEFYYTLDGSEPTTSSTRTVPTREYRQGFHNLYCRPAVSQPTTAKVIAVVDGDTSNPSEVEVLEINPDRLTSSASYGVFPADNFPASTRLSSAFPAAGENKTVYYTTGFAPYNYAAGRLDEAAAQANIVATKESPIATATTDIPLTAPDNVNQAFVIDALTVWNNTAVGQEYTSRTTLYFVSDPDFENLRADNIDKVIRQMSFEEKLSMTQPGGTSGLPSGAAGGSAGLDRMGIPKTLLADGPAGVNVNSRNSTSWLSPTGIASTWDKQAMEEVANNTGAEAKYYGVDVMLAPGMNIQRHSTGGRNFEYYSEDPVITGETAAAYVRGIQEEGVGVSLKHFAVNNSENVRRNGEVIISERTLREIYLRGFEIAIAEKPHTVMGAYNRINSILAHSNKWLMDDVLRGEWGFDGYVMSDWGANSEPVKSVEARMNMTQAYNTGGMIQDWYYASETPQIQEERLQLIERNVKDILGVVVKSNAYKGEYADLTTSITAARSTNFPTSDVYNASREVNLRVAGEGMVLLKNEDNVLPMTTGPNDEPKLTVINNSRASTASHGGLILFGSGSAAITINASYVTPLQTALENAGFEVPYFKTETAGGVVSEAAAQAENTDAFVFVISRNGQEGSDVTEENFNLSAAEISAFNAFADAFREQGKPVIAILNTGSAVNVQLLKEKADAILAAWLSGSEGSRAIAEILNGTVNPSGKLTQTFPLTYNDSPSIAMNAHSGDSWHANQNDPTPMEQLGWGTNPMYFDEGVFVGYRYYDTFNRMDRVAYPFGHGLSYTTFEYSDLTLNKTTFSTNDDDTVNVSVRVTNTGEIPGREVVQLYLGASTYVEEKRPVKELKHYEKTGLLGAGQSEIVHFTINKRDLQYFDDGNLENALDIVDGKSTVEYDQGRGWTVEEGTEFTVTIGSTSDSEVLAENGVTGRFSYGGEEIQATVALNKNTLELEVGEEETLFANITPITSTEVPAWTSSDESIAAVSGNGNVVAVGTGTAVITATLENGNSDTCVVTVSRKIPDKTTLLTFIDYAEEQMSLDGYQLVAKSVREQLEATLNQAKRVYDDPNATEEQVVAVKNELLKWIQALDMKEGNKVLLLDAVTTAESLNLDNYVAKGQARFKLALENAKKAFEDVLISQEEVNEATDELNSAMLSLRFKADTAILENLLNQVRMLNTTVFKDDSVKVLQAAIKSAENILDADLTQDQQSAVDQAFNNLLDAVSKLALHDDTCTCKPVAATPPVTTPTVTSPSTSAASAKKKVQKLARPKGLKLTANKATWKKVKNNSGYILKIKQGSKVIKTAQIEKNKKSYKIPKKLLKKGKKYKVTLVAKGTGNYKNSNAVTSKSRVLKKK